MSGNKPMQSVALVCLCVCVVHAQTKALTTAPENLESLRGGLAAHITQSRFAPASGHQGGVTR